MPVNKRYKTKYPGIHYIESRKGITYYMTYRINGKQTEEKAGHDGFFGMNLEKAHELREKKIRGLIPTNKELRSSKVRPKLGEEVFG